ncbi:phenylacetic acid degradation protein PaaN [Cytophagales bacterium LB-30]|uniref:Phenylacetic acid degradation protein PaaN n=1 Tax=Shiella aurantiaca TaxID=3058365 RepID=A0ABT8F7X6_9BACT|nr:phenylacetic acid degradation protein PaaN [Shiella aurantiaca]MDN4166582.1 phenylacetic acid degradation protein PaaN [Shiella aurantiaca]
MSLYTKHKDIIENAVKAMHERVFWAQFPENPSPKIYGETADEEGRKKFEASLNKNFQELRQAEADAWLGVEESPYTQQGLNIKYPAFSVEKLIDRGTHGFNQWRKVNYKERAGLLVETLERMKNRFFEIAYATMHTTGQGYMMAFQASGPHAADRALEAIAAGFEELGRFPEKTVWDKPMGKFNITLNKQWRAIPKGINLVVGCSTFPTWNTVPGVYAALITGNSVIVKPHPGAVLPIAIVVAEIQKVLSENGFDPNICQLAVDSFDKMITKDLAEHPSVKLIDYTGNSEFGTYLENIKGKVVFTEKTGVNSVILDSVENLDEAINNLGFSLNLYSGQMCTAPQNFYIPADGIQTPEGKISFDAFAEKFAASVSSLVDNPKAGPFVLGAIQNKNTCTRVEKAVSLGKLVLASKALENPMFPGARTASPIVLAVDSSQKEVFSKELFGPIALLIKTKNTDESIALAKEMAMEHGAISCAAYTTNEEVKEKIMDEMGQAATPVSFNLGNGIYVNQNAAFSDFHVTGGNPAGNASFTNADFVNKRFTWVGFREPVKA